MVYYAPHINPLTDKPWKPSDSNYDKKPSDEVIAAHLASEDANNPDAMPPQAPDMKPVDLTAQQPFVDARSAKHMNPDLQQALDNFVNGDGSVIDAAYEIEALARRIAIDMLQSEEFVEQFARRLSDMFSHNLITQSDKLFYSRGFRQKVLDMAWPETTGQQRDDLIDVIRQAQQHRESIYERAFLESSAFAAQVQKVVEDGFSSWHQTPLPGHPFFDLKPPTDKPLHVTESEYRAGHAPRPLDDEDTGA